MSKISESENVVRFPLERRMEASTLRPDRSGEVTILPVVRREYHAAPSGDDERGPKRA
jgi:hypothetical protein